MTHIDFVTTAVLNGIWQGTVLAAAMGLFLKLLPRLNPTTRFTLLWVTLLAVAALPLGPLALRVFTPNGRADSPAIETDKLRAIEVTPSKVQGPDSGLQVRATGPKSNLVLIPQSVPQSASEQVSESLQVRKVASRRASSVAAIVDHPLIRIRSGRILGRLAIIWVFVSLVLFARLAFGLRKLRRLKAGAVPVHAEWQLRLRALSRISGVRRQTQLLVSGQVAGPMSLGFFHPAILVPRALLDTLSNSELEHVVLHELAHLRRRDDWTNLAHKLIEAILPIQPAVYWIGHRMSIEREMACDDWVIAMTGTPKPYAASLTRVVELTQWGRADILAVGATGKRSQLFSRVQHMLTETRIAAPKLALRPLLAVIAALGALIYWSARAPQMIAFAEGPAYVNSAQGPIPPTSQNSLQTPWATVAAPASSAGPALPASLAQITGVQSPRSPLAPASPLLPRTPLAPIAALTPTASSSSQQSDETHMEMTTRNGWTSLSVKIDGAIEFTNDDRDIKSLSPGGHFRMTEGDWVSGRAYDVKADSAGTLTKTYLVSGSVKPLDPEGRSWLDRLLPLMIRESGIGAGPRVARILRQGGPQAVFTEIGLIHSDGSKRIYLEQLFAQATLNTEQLMESAKLIRGISSDGDKAQLLRMVDGRYFTRELRPYLFQAAESISSDGDKRGVLTDIIKKDRGNVDTLFSAANAAKHISSDGDKSEVLIEMATSFRASGGLEMAYFEAVKSISSDGDHARVLSALLAAHGDNRDTLAMALQSAEKISSDGDKARVLRESVPRYSDDEIIRKAFFDAVNSISSDGDRQQVLRALARRQGIGAAALGGIAKSAQRMSSDGDKALVLIELVGTNIEPVRDDFFAAANTIGSDGDHSHVLVTLLDKPGTSTTMAIAAIQSATRMSSEGDMGRVLLDAADRYSKDPSVDTALRKAVENLHSDGVYRSVMSEIARHNGSN